MKPPPRARGRGLLERGCFNDDKKNHGKKNEGQRTSLKKTRSPTDRVLFWRKQKLNAK